MKTVSTYCPYCKLAHEIAIDINDNRKTIPCDCGKKIHIAIEWHPDIKNVSETEERIVWVLSVNSNIICDVLGYYSSEEKAKKGEEDLLEKNPVLKLCTSIKKIEVW